MIDIKGYCCTQKCENDCNKCPYFSMSFDEVVMLCDKIRADAINTLIDSLEVVITSWNSLKDGADIPCQEVVNILKDYRMEQNNES